MSQAPDRWRTVSAIGLGALVFGCVSLPRDAPQRPRPMVVEPRDEVRLVRVFVELSLAVNGKIVGAADGSFVERELGELLEASGRFRRAAGSQPEELRVGLSVVRELRFRPAWLVLNTLTLALIPARIEEVWKIDGAISSDAPPQVSFVTVENSVIEWRQVLLLPAAPLYRRRRAVDSVVTDLLRQVEAAAATIPDS